MSISKTTSIKMIGLALLFSSCNQASNKDAYTNVYSEEQSLKQEEVLGIAQEPTSKLTSDGIPRQELKIIKHANSRFLVSDVDSIAQVIINDIKRSGGYVAGMNFNQSNYSIENRLKLTIPSENFESFISSITKHADFVDFNNISSQDVTEEYVDLKNRIRVKEDVKKRYEEILRTKTTTVTDVLKTEEQIRMVQEEIEVAKGRLNYISTRAAMSTIDLVLYEKVAYKHKPSTYTNSFSNKSTKAFKTGWDIVEHILLVIIVMWPILLLTAIILGLVYRKRLARKFLQKNN